MRMVVKLSKGIYLGLLHDGMETEAKNCFEYAERLFHELIERFHNNSDEYESENYALARSMGTWEEDDS